MHGAAPFSVSASADGKLIATAAGDHTVRLWDTSDGHQIGLFRPPFNGENGGETREAALSPDGKLLATSGPSGEPDTFGKKPYLYIYDAMTGAVVNRLGPLPDNIQDMEFSPDGKYLAAGLVRQGVLMWTAPFTAPPKSDSRFENYTTVWDVDFDRFGHLFAAGGDGSIRLYDMDLKPLAKAGLPHGGIPLSIAVNKDNSRLAIGYKDEARVDVLSLPDFKKADGPDLSFVSFGDLSQVEWSRSGETLYASGTYWDKALDKFQLYGFDRKGTAKPRVLGIEVAIESVCRTPPHVHLRQVLVEVPIRRSSLNCNDRRSLLKLCQCAAETCGGRFDG